MVRETIARAPQKHGSRIFCGYGFGQHGLQGKIQVRFLKICEKNLRPYVVIHCTHAFSRAPGPGRLEDGLGALVVHMQGPQDEDET